jgi:hypothetical protein
MLLLARGTPRNLGLTLAATEAASLKSGQLFRLWKDLATRSEAHLRSLIVVVMPLFNITYLSSVVPEFTRDELRAVLTENRARYQDAGISGILLYRDGNILQVLEGEESSVRKAYDCAMDDPRQTSLLPLIREPISRRQFSEWTMAFRDLSLDSDGLKGFNDALNSSDPETSLPLLPSKVKTFLCTFVGRASRQLI